MKTVLVAVAAAILSVAATTQIRPNAYHQPEPVRQASTASIASAAPFVTLDFSRAEVAAADGCTLDNRNIATLTGDIAPYLAGLSIPWAVTLDTAKLGGCTHAGASIMPSLSQVGQLAGMGASVGPHVYLSAKKLSSLTSAQRYQVTCGQASTIASWGFPASGLIAYPGAQAPPTELQDVAATCIDWGRRYNHGVGITDQSSATTPPYWQMSEAMNGGPCADITAPCSAVTPLTGSARYVTPDKVIVQIRSLVPGQWLTLQGYILVTGQNPAYAVSGQRWDCTSSDPRLHWTNDNERYCFDDWKQIVQAAISAGVTIATPSQVASAWGRMP